MHKIKLILVSLCLLFATGAANIDYKPEYCFPENDLYISVNAKRTTAMTEEVFNHVIDVVEDIYSPIVADLGGDLQIERKWKDGTVNAYAQRLGKVYKVFMFGGLARHDAVTPDGFAMVVCHEIGHHIGGAPKKSSWMGWLTWASNEGQADYWGANKCMKKVMEVLEEVAESETPDYLYAKKECEARYSTEDKQKVCLRTSMAGKSLAELFRALRNSSKELHFDTPDTKVVTTTNHNHPDSQCRMDTYFAGALCDKEADAEISDTDAKKGFCSRSEGYTIEARPLCWFKP